MGRYLVQGRTYGDRIIRFCEPNSKAACMTEMARMFTQIMDHKLYEVELYQYIEVIDQRTDRQIFAEPIPIEYVQPYDAYARFDPTLNESQPVIELFGSSYTPAQILRHLDPVTYYARLDTWAKENGIIIL